MKKKILKFKVKKVQTVQVSPTVSASHSLRKDFHFVLSKTTVLPPGQTQWPYSHL